MTILISHINERLKLRRHESRLPNLHLVKVPILDYTLLDLAKTGLLDALSGIRG